LEREFNFEKDSWICPQCGDNANKYFCGNCGFKIYAGFSLRFVSSLIDSFVWFPFIIVVLIFRNLNIGQEIVLNLSALCFYIFYDVYLVGLWGQTLGKMYTRIKIVRLDGSKTRWSNAWLRHSVELTSMVFLVLLQIFISCKATMSQTLESVDTQMPNLEWAILAIGFLNAVSMLYGWTEVIVLLTNKKRRAIHDFIAGTVVIHDLRLTKTPWKSKVEPIETKT